jgi:hypothetical protein
MDSTFSPSKFPDLAPQPINGRTVAKESPCGMQEESPNARMEAALNSSSPYTALRSLAQALKAEGMPQREMYELFEHYRPKHEDDIDQTRHDAIMDTMDCIVGWCGPGERLFDTCLK